MAFEIRQFTLTIPAGTLPTAPVTLDCSFPPRIVDGLEAVVPAGGSGLVGWRVLNSNVQRIPYGSDPWIITSGEIVSWPLQDQINSGSWQVQGYNSGLNDHKVYFRFLLSLLGEKVVQLAPTMDAALINDQAPEITETGA